MGRKSTLLPRHQEILSAIDRGESFGHIVRALATNETSLRHYLRANNLRPQKRPGWRWIDVDPERLAQLIRSGKTQVQIAQALGVSENTIVRRVSALGLGTGRTGPRLAQGHRACWKNGRFLEKHGYIEVYVPLHPLARRQNGHVMEVALGRYLTRLEVVHHEDEHPRHNWPENLGLFASNADHLRHELTGRTKATRRSSIPGAYGNNQTIVHCPDIRETLAQAPSEIRQRLEHHIAIHQPTIEQQSLRFREILRSGANRQAFQYESMA